MVWNQTKIDDYLTAVKLLYKIKNQAFKFIAKEKASEFDTHQFVLEKYKEYGLVTDDNKCIVAYRQNTAYIHYFPSERSKRLKKNTLVMLDIWAKLKKQNAPYADITWMGFYGKIIPREIRESFKLVSESRNLAIRKLRRSLRKRRLPTGCEIDGISRDFIRTETNGYDIPHTVGHSLGTKNDHGRYAGISKKNIKAIRQGLGYTIEPGIYYSNRYGVRSEVDFYINDKMKLIVSPKVQKKIEIIK